MVRLSLAVAIICGLQSQEENRDYKSWSACKAGSWARVSMAMSMDGRDMSMEILKTLKSVDEKEAVVELKASINSGGRKMDMPGQNEHIPAKGPSKYQPVKKDDKVEEGDEELTLDGKKVACHWFKCSVDMEKWKGTAKVWLSAEIPGGLAKMESQGDDEKAGKIRMTVIGWEKK